MPTVTIHFVGANLYVPNRDSSKLMVVLPNATQLGVSPDGVADGSRPDRHWPTLRESVLYNAQEHFSVPTPFPGSRLLFDFGVTPALDLTAIMGHSAKGWFEAPNAVLGKSPGDSVAAQVLVTAGTVSIYTPPLGGACKTEWSPKSAPFGESIDPVIRGLTLTVPNATMLKASAETWLTDPDTKLPVGTKTIFSRALAQDAVFYVGNQCAGDIVGWIRNSVGDRAVDSDFRWLFGLSESKAVASYLLKSRTLPTPEVEGSQVDATLSVNDAFAVVINGGGGAVGCECQGCVDAPHDF